MSSLDSTQAILETAMRGAWQRQNLLTENMANAETPGYKRVNLNFQASLRTAIQGGMSAESMEALGFQPESEAHQAAGSGNGVNVDQESALLAENGLDYQMLTQMLSAHDGTLRAAIGLA